MAYGAGVDPNFEGSVTKLYPFSFSSKVHGNMVKNEQKSSNYQGACGGNGPVRVASGVVTRIHDHGFSVRVDDGNEFDIHVSECTMMSSNKMNYKMKHGDKAIVKGAQKRYNQVNASQMTCLRE